MVVPKRSSLRIRRVDAAINYCSYCRLSMAADVKGLYLSCGVKIFQRIACEVAILEKRAD